MYYFLPITSEILYQIMIKTDALTSNFGAQIPPGWMIEMDSQVCCNPLEFSNWIRGYVEDIIRDSYT